MFGPNFSQNWEKLGRVYAPGDKPFTHGAVPFAHMLGGNRYKIYFSQRDSQNRAAVNWVTIRMNDPLAVLEAGEQPVLTHGDPGYFDDAGAMGASLVDTDGELRMYYIGWNTGSLVPFRNSIGIAFSADNGVTFDSSRLRGPVLDRTPLDPCFVTAPCVIKESGIFKMWYSSGLKWQKQNNGLKHYYHIKYRESDNGFNWGSEAEVAIDFENDDEYAISVPRVLRVGEQYHMWYCYRGETYRIGYAYSTDAKTWKRADHLVNLALGATGEWDSAMLCYPFIFEDSGKWYLLYNGNGYGESGFGIAVLS